MEDVLIFVRILHQMYKFKYKLNQPTQVRTDLVVQLEECLASKWIVHGTNLRSVAQRQSLCVRIEGLAKLVEVRQRLAQLQIGMLAVQQQTEYSLSSACIIDDLFSKKDLFETIIFNDGSSWLVVLNPFEEKDQSMDGTGRIKLKIKQIF